jgi:hypothetical protein
MFNQLLRECKHIYNRNGYPVAALRTAQSGFSLEDSKRLQLWETKKPLQIGYNSRLRRTLPQAYVLPRGWRRQPAFRADSVYTGL